MGKRYDVCTPRPKRERDGEDAGTWWHRVGSAWRSDEGRITIYLDSVPVPDPKKENKIVMVLFEPREKEDGAVSETGGEASSSAPRSRGGKTRGKDSDDEIPF